VGVWQEQSLKFVQFGGVVLVKKESMKLHVVRQVQGLRGGLHSEGS
jgi:hypothetical protein